jgi:hypothetical protein
MRCAVTTPGTRLREILRYSFLIGSFEITATVKLDSEYLIGQCHREFFKRPKHEYVTMLAGNFAILGRIGIGYQCAVPWEG